MSKYDLSLGKEDPIAPMMLIALVNPFNVDFLKQVLPFVGVGLIITFAVLLICAIKNTNRINERTEQLLCAVELISNCVSNNKDLPESIGTNFTNLKKRIDDMGDTLNGYVGFLRCLEASSNELHDEWHDDAERRTIAHNRIMAIHEKITDKTTAGVQEQIQRTIETMLPLVQRLSELHPVPKWENGERPVHWCAINDIRPVLMAISEQLGEQRRNEQDDLTNLLMLVRLVGTIIEKIDRLSGLVSDEKTQHR